VRTNPYQRHAEANLLSNSPLELVVVLYRGAVDAVLAACRFNEENDHSGRGRSVNKALDILLELTASLDVTAGGPVAVQLRDLYAYMQDRLIQAHTEASNVKLIEVAGLMRTLLDGWQQIAAGGGKDAGYGLGPGSVASVPSEGLASSLEYSRL
jgi:flagellar protein FliS